VEEQRAAPPDSGETIDAADAAIERIFDLISTDDRCRLVSEELREAYRNDSWTADGIGRKLAAVGSSASVGTAGESRE
jgi:hypothetical protein